MKKKKWLCENCARCVNTPNDGRENDGYCLEMEIIVNMKSEACVMAVIDEEEEEEE